MHWAGSDYDYDIIFTCDNPNFINGVYPDQRVVTYNAKKPHKKPAREMTDLDLYNTVHSVLVQELVKLPIFVLHLLVCYLCLKKVVKKKNCCKIELGRVVRLNRDRLIK